jgi:hypothetical protein
VVGKAEYLSETPAVLVGEDQHDERRQEQAAREDDGGQFPGDLLLSGPRVHKAHDADGVEGREEVEDLEEVVPCP